jgi:hypothetical protein
MTSIRCTGCGKEIDGCSACDGEDCEPAICLECLVVECGESVGPTHERRNAPDTGRIGRSVRETD